MKVRDIITIINSTGLEFQATILAIAKNDVLVSAHGFEPKCFYVDKERITESQAWFIK